jgi:hypothetical protein
VLCQEGQLSLQAAQLPLESLVELPLRPLPAKQEIQAPASKHKAQESESQDAPRAQEPKGKKPQKEAEGPSPRT